MIISELKEILLEKKEHFLIESERVASVLDTHPLSHAFLILTKVKYAKIPVLNKHDELVGFIGLPDIVNNMLSNEGVDFNNLDGKIVSDVMDNNVRSISSIEDVEMLLHLAVDHSFIPVRDEQNRFLGIVTRRELFKAINHLLHTLDDEYVLTSKEHIYKLVAE
ncbi:cyclic-di-AMP-binding protein CbpB [Vagococcus xieshaowenii]|uniref:CBS domain-containing protein n=1 Tax=Vagococcus xieshaowenii TaxID=2562451 RepID=A0AAJ5EFH6_9ENTE|nr:cyclic-di-AMP-binding protein CbpB [Vagococcus xieshaowenii]QCA28404.1 CBS domain-containing protein [Vagococcus xieshaowenii]TFZ42840.1 CBS domain-containing protein [Vagococcus xieshaowenii]